MPQILVRNLDGRVVDRLKQRARCSGRSLQSEVKAILDQAACLDMRAAARLASTIREGIGRRASDDSARLVRQDRNR